MVKNKSIKNDDPDPDAAQPEGSIPQQPWSESSANPKNWPPSRRWTLTLVLSLFMIVSPISSSIVAPALPILRDEFAMGSELTTQMVLSVFILSSAVGPLVISPLSEVYGRRVVLHVTMLVFSAFNLACALSRTGGQLLAFRFLAGIGGSAPSIGPGILGDCWRPEERGKSLGLYYIFTLLGPALGPIVGGFIVRYADWRWMFYSTSALSVAIQVIGLFTLPETFPPLIAGKSVTATGLSESPVEISVHQEEARRPWKVLSDALIRPTKLILTQPIIQMLAVYLAYMYGLLYLALSTYVTVWTVRYRQTDEIASLNYLSMAAGFTVCTQSMAQISDRVYKELKARNNGTGLPEHRAPLLIPGAVLVPAGFFLYGWSVEYSLHWAIPNLGALFFSGGIIISMQSITSYVVDAYPLYSASATAALTVLRAIAGFAFPLFGPYMYERMGYGWGNSLLGFLAVAVGWPAPFVLWKYGAYLRSRSTYATEGLRSH